MNVSDVNYDFVNCSLHLIIILWLSLFCYIPFIAFLYSISTFTSSGIHTFYLCSERERKFKSEHQPLSCLYLSKPHNDELLTFTWVAIYGSLPWSEKFIQKPEKCSKRKVSSSLLSFSHTIKHFCNYICVFFLNFFYLHLFYFENWHRMRNNDTTKMTSIEFFSKKYCINRLKIGCYLSLCFALVIILVVLLLCCVLCSDFI